MTLPYSLTFGHALSCNSPVKCWPLGAGHANASPRPGSVIGFRNGLLPAAIKSIAARRNSRVFFLYSLKADLSRAAGEGPRWGSGRWQHQSSFALRYCRPADAHRRGGFALKHEFPYSVWAGNRLNSLACCPFLLWSTRLDSCDVLLLNSSFEPFMASCFSVL
jgi:hypothetical protein